MNSKTTALKKAVGDRFKHNPFAKKYKETNEHREESRTIRKHIEGIPAGLKRK